MASVVLVGAVLVGRDASARLERARQSVPQSDPKSARQSAPQSDKRPKSEKPERNEKAEKTGAGEPERLSLPGHADAFYYKPKFGGRRPVLMFLHGRGGNPQEDCRKWAKVGTAFGWVVCPQGPEDRGGGARAWNNSVPVGKTITDAALSALRERFHGRVQSRGNVLIGFSEGAFIAMQLGVQDPATWSRWLILAANDQYWWGDTSALLKDIRAKVKGIYLFTGESDEVAPNTKRVADIVKAAKIPVKLTIAPGTGHEIPADRMVFNYKKPLLWLTRAR